MCEYYDVVDDRYVNNKKVRNKNTGHFHVIRRWENQQQHQCNKKLWMKGGQYYGTISETSHTFQQLLPQFVFICLLSLPEQCNKLKFTLESTTLVKASRFYLLNFL